MTTKTRNKKAMRRTAVREATPCPYCLARRGEKCQGEDGRLREPNHAERIELAEDSR